MLLTAADLSFGYGDQRVLSATSISIRAGERIALLGANGAGKSTLLQALAGQIDAGPVACGGRIIDVPQEADLTLFCATVRDELAYGPRESRRSVEEVERRVNAAASALNVASLLAEPPQGLSKGQRVRVAVAAALACLPEVLILDEPTIGQDRAQCDPMFEGLACHMQHGALIFATHDRRLARAHATRIWEMDGGRIIRDCAPGTLDDAEAAR